MNRHFNRRQLLKVAGATTGVGAMALTGGARMSAAPLPRSTVGATHAAQADVSGKVTMMFWDGPPLIDIRRQTMEPFKAKFPNVELEVINVPGGYGAGYADKLTTMIAGGVPPDIFIVPDSDLPHYLTNNIALDISPYVERDNYDLTQFPENAIDNYRYQGGIYGLPDNITTIGLFYNKSLFEEAGAEEPATSLDDGGWNFQAYLEAAQQLTQREGGRTTVYGAAPNLATIGWVPWVWANGGEFTNAEITELMIHEEPAIEAIQFLVDLMHKHEVAPRPEATTDASINDIFKTGRIAMIDACVCQIANFRSIDTFEWDGAFRPAGAGGHVDYLYAYPLLIHRDTQSPDAAWEALRFFEDEAMLEIVKAGGLQGTKMTQMLEHLEQPGEPPEHAEVFITSVEELARPLPLINNYREIDRIITQGMEALWIGQEQDVRMVVTELKATVDSMLEANRFDR